MPSNPENTPLLKKKSEDEILSVGIELTTNSNEEALKMLINILRDGIIEENRDLTNEDIQALTLLSLTCKNMYHLLSVAEPTSPLYYIPPRFLLNKINTLLTIKLNHNKKNIPIKYYLDRHISLLEGKPLDPAEKNDHSITTPPPPESNLWNHGEIQLFIQALIYFPPLIIMIIFNFMDKLPLTKELHNYLATHLPADSGEPNNKGATVLTWFALFFLYGTPMSFALLLATTVFIPALLKPIWLNNAKSNLREITYYPEDVLTDALKESEALNEIINSSEIASENAEEEKEKIIAAKIKHKTLTLFAKVNAIKEKPAAPNNMDIEAQLRIKR